MRVPSPHPCPSGGWFHFLVERPKRVEVRRGPKPPVRPRMFDAAVTMAGFRAEFESPGVGRDIFDSLLEIAGDIGLGAAYVDRLEVGRSAFHRAWAFPMRDAEGGVVGIRLREYGGCRKWSVAGSRDGLFFDPALVAARTVVNGVASRELTIVEGATDCMAGYALGLACVGRSACATGGDLLAALCDRLHVQRVTIIADNDRYHCRPDGTLWRPGMDGARALAQRLGLPYRIIVPACKDLRDWVRAGLDATKYARMAELQLWHRPIRARVSPPPFPLHPLPTPN